MATKVKLEGNARYLAKFKSISIRFPVEDWPEIETAANKSRQSVSAYTLQAVKERMERDAAN